MQTCQCCSSTNDVRSYKITGGLPMCMKCHYEWYDGGGTDVELILRGRFPEEFTV